MQNALTLLRCISHRHMHLCRYTHLILCFALLHFVDIVLLLYACVLQMEGLWLPAMSRSISAIFLTIIF